MSRPVSRRLMIATTVAAAAAVSMVPAPTVGGTAADPLPGLWRQHQALEAERAAAQAALDAKKDELHAVNLFRPRARIGTFWEGATGFGPHGEPQIPGEGIYAYSIDEIPTFGDATGPNYLRHVAAFKQSQAACDHARTVYGHDALFAATRAAEDRLWTIDKAIEEAEPVSIAGLLAKLQYVGWLTLSTSADNEDWSDVVLRRTIADAARLAKIGGAA